MDLREWLRQEVAFDWDDGNILKNWEKHRVKPSECEDVFFNTPVVDFDQEHSQHERRYFAFGHTDRGRKLFIVFTIRGNKIRIISARDMHRKERRFYREKT